MMQRGGEEEFIGLVIVSLVPAPCVALLPFVEQGRLYWLPCDRWTVTEPGSPALCDRHRWRRVTGTT